MKKRIISLTLAVMMIAATLIGCGGNDTTKNETPVTPNTEVTTETPTPETNVPETETPEVENKEETWTPLGTYEFPEGMEGFTEKYVSALDENWSYNGTHYVDINGNVMDFAWYGPTTLGERASYTDNTLALYGENCTLRAWYPGEMGLTNMDELNELLEVDKETWQSLALITPIENGYYNVERVDNMVYVTYAVKDNGMVGYAHFLANGETNNYYRFIYLEDENVYDDARALKVIESIKYWDYEETN